MKNEQQLRAEYHDLLGDSQDADLFHLVAHLDSDLAYKVAEPPPYLVAAVDGQEKRLTENKRILHRLLPVERLPRRASTIAACLLAMIILMGAGYAALPAFWQVFQLNSGTGAIVSDNLGREVNISRTVDGFTMTVRRVYADANQIVIGYTLSGPPGRAFNSILAWGEFNDTPGHRVTRSPILTDAWGKEFGGGGAPVGNVKEGEAFTNLLIYDGLGAEASAREIKVRLTVGKLLAYERLENNTFRDLIVDGPFLFDLTVPVEQGRVAEPRQVVEAGGMKAVLDRVVTTATGTRVSLWGVGPTADVSLTVEGSTYKLHPPEGQATPSRWSTESRWEFVTETPLADKHGEWVLKVKLGTKTRSEGGPWAFRFTVP